MNTMRIPMGLAVIAILCAPVHASDLDSALAQMAGSAVDVDAVCNHRARRSAFVWNSLKLVENGADKDAVLSVLLCIATNPDVDRQIGSSAVRALFHLAADNERIREYLQRILTEDGTHSGVIKDACDLLIYVANDDARSALLEVVRQQWPSMKARWAVEALAELGDEGVLTWIDQMVKDPPTGHMHRGYFDTVRRRVEIQRSVPAMLAYIEGDRTDIERRWVIRQAIRHGASRTDVRRSAMAYLRRSDPESNRYHRLTTVRACDEVAAFAPEDAQELDVISRTRKITVSTDPPGPRWATLPDAKRNEFYRLYP